MKSKKAFYRFREDTSWSKTGKFGQFLTTFGDMENGWKKSFCPTKDENSATTAPRTRGDHPDHHAQSCLTFQGSIRSAPFVFILAGEIAIDPWPDLARSLRSCMVGFACSTLPECFRSFGHPAYRIAPRSAADRSHPLAIRCSKSAADHLYLRSKDEKRGFGFQSLVQRHPRHRLFIFAGESLRGKRCDHLEFSLVLLPIVATWGQSWPVRVRFGRLGRHGHYPFSASSSERG